LADGENRLTAFLEICPNRETMYRLNRAANLLWIKQSQSHFYKEFILMLLFLPVKENSAGQPVQ